MTARRVILALSTIAAIALASAIVHAHVGSPDVFVEADAGPYHVFVTVRPPPVIPGVADVEILVPASQVRAVRIVPVPVTDEATRFAPTADRAVPSADDPRRFSGHLWMMMVGAWQVVVTVEGDLGTGTIAVPVPTLPQATKAMSHALGAVLFGLMLLLFGGLVAIVSTAAREASLEAGENPTAQRRRRGRIAGVVASVVIAGVLTFGYVWWTAEASSYERYVYKPLDATAAISGSGRLALRLTDPGWLGLRRLDDLVPDHGHVMHLFVVSPTLDRLWHLHPTAGSAGAFEQQLPAMRQGRYEFFADVVHATGIGETATGGLETPELRGAPLAGDDSAWSGSPRSGGASSELPDGSRIVWDRAAEPLRTRQLTLFTFRVENAAGRPATDLELYMGMPGHAIFVRRDRQVFAHVHPAGSAPMASLEISQRSIDAPQGVPVMPAGMHEGRDVPPTVTFPYGFPSPGDYRIFVQMKRAGRIDTGAFDAHVE